MKLGKNHPTTKRLTKAGRAQAVNQCIEIIHDSIASHMPYTHQKVSKNVQVVSGNEEFHKKSIKEYQWCIFLLTQLY